MSEEKRSLFKKLDVLIFEQVNKYKASNIYAQITDQLSTLPEDQQKIIGQVTNIFLLIFPVIIILFFLVGNINKQSDLEIKKDILTNVDRFLQNKNKLEGLSNTIISPFKIANKNNLSNRFSRVTNISTQSEKPKIEIAEFNQENLNDSFVRTSAFIEFSNFSSKLFQNFLNEVLVVSKLKVNSIIINKNEENNFIDGNIEIIHYGKK